jgi:membrane protease YdiL (CAAX protease family)
MGGTLLHFAVFLGVAWFCSRASADQMLLRWQGGIAPIWRGFLYSIALRLLVIVVGLLVVAAIIIVQGTSALDSIRAPAEHLVDRDQLASDPMYFFLNLTLVSFVVAGLREEIWRAGVFAGLWALFPQLGQTLWGKVITVLITAVIFGLGHLPQGWLGVALTSFLGIALGAIMVFHRSIWDAVVAHGFFDATTFLMLYLIALLKWPLGGH